MTRAAAIQFEPDGYVVDGPKLMGRQAAGNAYLRAAVEGRGDEPLAAYTPHKKSAEVFARMVQSMDSKARAEWIPSGRLDLLQGVGAVHAAGPVLREFAMLRLRANPAAYSLTGVTHTTASHTAMDAIAALPTLPLMPWDAVICTSRAVLDTVEIILGAEREYLAWRLGPSVTPPMPQLPVIPLGVHCRDFVSSDEERRAARTALGLAEGDVAALFVGRLSFHAKAHPHAMYAGLEEAAKRTGKKVALIECGWFANTAIEKAFRDGARNFAPSVRSLMLDGRNPEARKAAWAAADIFVSLSDNIQETFGLAPVEAMAAGLPVVATDWDGYRDTVRDGLDGYLIPTAQPAPGLGTAFALAHESGEVTYDQYCGLACRTVSVDMGVLADRLTDLVKSRELRLKLGASGRSRALADLDWRVVYARYRELWTELGELRGAAGAVDKISQLIASAPRQAASRLDPMLAFAGYPTVAIGTETRLAALPGATIDAYRALKADALFSYVPEALPGDELVAAMLGNLGKGGATPSELAAGIKAEPGPIAMAAAVLAKMGLIKV